MTKTVQLLSDELAAEEQCEFEAGPFIVEDLSVANSNGEGLEPDVDAAVSLILPQHEIYVLYHIRCAENTLQLAVRDNLKRGKPEKLLTKVRKIAPYVRKPPVSSILQRRARKGMVLDMPTRWESTHTMLQRLQELKSVMLDMGT